MAKDSLFLFGFSNPRDDYFNDNLDQYFDEDDYFDYDIIEKEELEDPEYSFSHKHLH